MAHATHIHTPITHTLLVAQDIACDNGLIHVIDGVCKPQEILPANNGSGSAGASAAW